MLYQINKGTFSYGADVVFSDIQFEVKNTEKIAIVGRNGCGKSTLLKVILEEFSLDSGIIHKMNSISIGSLSQIVFSDSNATVEQELLQVFEPIIKMQDELNILENNMINDHSEQLLLKYADLQHKFDQDGGYTYLSDLYTMLTKFNFTKQDLLRHISTFSGGQQTRLAFVKLLISKPDILLLDEPTNHLDLDTIEWLEGYVKRYPKAVVIVSHDRAFLDNVAEYVYELEYEVMTKYTGNYTSFVKQKTSNQEILQKAYTRQVKEIDRLNMLIEKFRYKGTKAAFAQSKIKYLDRMEKVEVSESDNKNFKVNFECARKGGKQVLKIDELVIGYDKPLATINLEILQGQRIAVVGKNGHGKSTFLKTIMDQIKPLSGDYLLGHQIEIAYFDQLLIQFDQAKSVLEEIWDDYPDMKMSEVRTLLGSFLFSSDDVFKDVSVLSQGEKVRLYFAKLVLKKANFLVLDEPTNHLDILGKEALEDALLGFDGTILFVSHDRYFIKKICNQILKIEDGKAINYPYGYEQFNNEANFIVENKKVEKSNQVVKQVKKASPSDIKKIEKQIEQKEVVLEDLRELRFEPEYYQDSDKMTLLDSQIDDAVNEVNKLMNKWEEMLETSM